MSEIYDLILKAIEEEADKCRDYPSYIHTQVTTGAVAWQKDYDKWKTRDPANEINYKPVEPRRDTSDYDDDEDDEYYYDDFDDYYDDHRSDYADEYWDEESEDYQDDGRTYEEYSRDRAREDFEAQRQEKEEREVYIRKRDDAGKIFGQAADDFKGASRDVHQYIVKMGSGSQLIIDVDDIVSITAKSGYTKASKKELSKLVKDAYNVSKPDAPIWNKQEVFLKSCDDMKEFCKAKELNELKRDAKALTKPLVKIANNLETFIEKYEL